MHEVPQEDERGEAGEVERGGEGIGEVVEVLDGVHGHATEGLDVAVAVVKTMHETINYQYNINQKW